jgi:hypothetical protein
MITLSYDIFFNYSQFHVWCPCLCFIGVDKGVNYVRLPKNIEAPRKNSYAQALKGSNLWNEDLVI